MARSLFVGRETWQLLCEPTYVFQEKIGDTTAERKVKRIWIQKGLEMFRGSIVMVRTPQKDPDQ